MAKLPGGGQHRSESHTSDGGFAYESDEEFWRLRWQSMRNSARKLSHTQEKRAIRKLPKMQRKKQRERLKDTQRAGHVGGVDPEGAPPKPPGMAAAATALCGCIVSFFAGLVRAFVEGIVPLLPLLVMVAHFFLRAARVRNPWRSCRPSSHSAEFLKLVAAATVLLPIASAVAVEHTEIALASVHRQLQTTTTALTDANIRAAVDACLAEDPVYMVCPNTEYGDAADWDVGAVTSFDFLLADSVHRPGGPAASGQFVGGPVFTNWNIGSVTSTVRSAHPPSSTSAFPRSTPVFVSPSRSFCRFPFECT